MEGWGYWYWGGGAKGSRCFSSRCVCLVVGIRRGITDWKFTYGGIEVRLIDTLTTHIHSRKKKKRSPRGRGCRSPFLPFLRFVKYPLKRNTKTNTRLETLVSQSLTYSLQKPVRPGLRDNLILPI